MTSTLLQHAARRPTSVTASADTHQPPDSVQANGRRALELIADGKAGPGFTDTGRARAKQLAGGDPLSTDVVRKMAAYFARHDSGDEGKQHEEGTPAHTAWLAWGGDSGKHWADSIVRELAEQVTTASAASELAAVRDGDVWRFDTVTAAPAAAEPTDTIPEPVDGDLSATVAAAIPVQPPADWFGDPQLDGPTALTVTADGRVYGHAAAWGVRHIGLPGCRTAPKSTSGYRYYRTGQVECADGTMVATGRITLGTGHADLAGNLTAASEHYDNTGAAVADVACGEDTHGIWFAGALRPDVEPAQVRALRASSLSGDWRPAGHHLEMVGLLAVNVPGFPTPRAALAASGAEVAALVAAGVVLRPTADHATPAAIVDDALTAATEPSGTESGGSSSYDEEKHPRDAQGQWAPKNEEAKQAQKDPKARTNYGTLEKGGEASAAMLKGMSDGDLRALTKFAYSSKTSDPKIVAARIRVAGEMGKRGIDIKKNGAAGGGSKKATRASAAPVADTDRHDPATEHEETDVSDQPDTDPIVAASDTDSPAGSSFEEGDTVTIGETGLSGEVASDVSDDGDDDTVAVAVHVPRSLLTKVDAAPSPDAAMAAALAPLAASLQSISERLDRQDAERRAERGAEILDGLPG